MFLQGIIFWDDENPKASNFWQNYLQHAVKKEPVHRQSLTKINMSWFMVGNNVFSRGQAKPNFNQGWW